MRVRELFDEFQRAEVHLCVGYGKATMIYGRGPMQTEFVLFLEAVRVHTVFPLSERSHEQADLEKTALRYYPLAGALIAAIAAFTWLIAGGILPVEIASTIAIAASLLISGAKQEDALASWAAKVADQKLSRAAVIISLLIRWAALSAMQPIPGAIALLLSGAAGRAAIVAAMRHVSRVDHDDSDVADDLRPSRADLGIAAATVLVLSVLAGWYGFLGLAIATVAATIAVHLGAPHTGDRFRLTLGAACQAAEIAVLITLAGAFQ